MTLAVEEDLELDRSATFYHKVYWTEAPLFGYSGDFLVRKGTKVVAEGEVLLGQLNPTEIQIKLTAEQTQVLPERGLQYDLLITAPDGFRSKVSRGRLLVY